MCLPRFGATLGDGGTPVLSRKELTEPALRTQTLVGELSDHGPLSGAIHIPSTLGPMTITVDLRAKCISCHVDIDASRKGRAVTRVNWLLRQLKTAPDGVRIEAHVAHARGAGASELLRDLRDNPVA